jgi:hypothetical protein
MPPTEHGKEAEAAHKAAEQADDRIPYRLEAEQRDTTAPDFYEWSSRAGKEILGKLEKVFDDPQVMAAAWWYETNLPSSYEEACIVRYSVQAFSSVPAPESRRAFEVERPAAAVQWVVRSSG